MAWNSIDPWAGDELVAAAKHDLIFHEPWWFALKTNTGSLIEWDHYTGDSIHAAGVRVNQLKKLNPNLIILVAVRYYDAPPNALPAAHRYWLRDSSGQRVSSWPEGGYLKLDFDQPELRALIAHQAEQLMATGLFDGLFFDWWFDDHPDRRRLLKAIRDRLPTETLVMVNGNDRTLPNTADLVNGSFMECWQSRDWGNWSQIEETLIWNETNLRQPRINAVSTWYAKSRNELNRMRATTTLVMTRSNGYALFSDPNDLLTPDHQHDWYKFWDEDLGQPIAPGRDYGDGTVRRAFTHGWAVYHRPSDTNLGPMSKRLIIRFDIPHRSSATGRIGTEHALPAADGDLYLVQHAAE